MKRSLAVLATIVTLLLTAGAQTVPITWSGELRLRSEIDGRDLRNVTPPNLYTLSRARMGLLARPAENISLFLQWQDSRGFGEAASTTSSLNAGEVHQAWFEVTDLLPGLRIKAGKMELNVANGRLISNNVFLNVPRTLPGLTASWTTGLAEFTGMLFSPRETPAPPTASTKFAWVRDAGDLLAGATVRLSVSADHAVELIGIHHRIGKADALGRDSLSVTSLGGYVKGSFGTFAYEADGAYQMGSMFGTDVSAYQAGALLTYLTGGSSLASVTAAVDLYSGRSISSTTIGTFDPRFGAGHKNLGYMDYFTAIPAHTSGRGIIDVYGRMEWTWTASVGTQVTAHLFQLHRTLSVLVPSRDLGQEVDLITRWKHSSALSVEFGAAVILPGTALKSMIGGSDPGVWFYLSPQINF